MQNQSKEKQNKKSSVSTSFSPSLETNPERKGKKMGGKSRKRTSQGNPPSPTTKKIKEKVTM